MQRSRKNYKRYSTKYGKTRRRTKANMTMVTWPGCKPVLRKYELDLPVYIYSPAIGSGYSFAISGSGYTYHANAFLPLADAEMQDYFNQHSHYKVHGCEMKFVRSLNAAVSTVYQLPEISFCLVPYLSTTQQNNLNKDTATNNDGAFRVQPLNSESNPKSKYYRMSAPTFSNTSIACGGNVLIPTNMTANFNAILGFDQYPSLSSVNDSPVVGSLKLTWYLSFHNPIRVNNY